MRHVVNKPTIKKVQARFPYCGTVPRGYRSHLIQKCRTELGKSYYRWVGKWYQPWAIYDDAVWQYEDGYLYVKHQDDLGMITLSMISKQRKVK